ncbi:MAG: bifunctional phosphopantothenoylcysteine decarboxylase/phosphopantothenate--cysteine ligase CoaBC [Desulfurococcales archaeon]|nr:bifunctional phosphopantothenoylcysteine decarboxylase/phosphopantothenate--cysteine ligase CoaBC [Desulfurococcales archaeon]
MAGYHPSQDILGEVNNYAGGRCIVMGITGSVAAYKAIDTARWVMRRGARVRIVMTREAARLVSPRLLHWAVGTEPIVEATGDVEHISLAKECDSMAVSPATLSTMSKIAHGVADNIVALTAVSFIGYSKPLVIVPSMHENMHLTPQYREVESELKRQGAIVVPPLVEGGIAKYPDPHLVGRVIVAATVNKRSMEGHSFLVTAGATREWIDRVRFISNPSTGLMGVELGIEAWARGSGVDLVHGHVEVPIPHFLRRHAVETTKEMAEVVAELTRSTYDIIAMAAAPVDFTPSSRVEGKISSGEPLSLALEPAPKVIKSIDSRPRVLVAFAAEVVSSLAELEAKAWEKLNKYDADILVANIVGSPGSGFASERSRVVIVDRDYGVLARGYLHKEILAKIIVDEALKKL